MDFRRFAASTAIITTVGAIALACSSDPPGSNESSACAQLAAAYRAWATKCGADLSDTGWKHYEARMAQDCTSLTSLPGSGMTSANVNACADATRRAACPGGAEDFPTCDFPSGTLADGAACTSDQQCMSRSCKKPPVMPGSSACGVCEARVPIGGACTTEALCAPGSICSAGTCVAIVRNDAGGGCDSTKGQYCRAGAGLYCDRTTKTCKESGAVGATCSSAAPRCQHGLTCSSASNTCVAVAIAREGEACAGTSPVTCDVNLTCDSATDKCIKIIWVASGGDCSAVGSRCERGTCNGETKKCQLVIADGQPCGDPKLGVCDAFASCVDGKCQMVSSIVCK